jgi:hypothetical protein
MDFLDPVKVRKHLSHTARAGVGVGIEALHVLVQEGLEDGVLAAVPGVHHGTAVSRATTNLCGRGCFPALLHDQLSRSVQQAAVRQLHALRLGESVDGGRHGCILDGRQLC